jgi:hypothetical protein
MSLRILYPGDRNTLSTLASAAFSRQNYGLAGMTSTRITADTPDGALGGMVAMYSGNYEVTIGDASHIPAGFFINDAAGSPFENTPAVASGKCPFTTSMGSYETDLYETRKEDNSLDLVYAVGDLLYCSKNGLITKDPALAATTVIGVVSKAWTPTDPFLGFNSKI